MGDTDGPARRRRLIDIARSRSGTNLVPIGWAIGGMLALALVITTTVTTILFVFLPFTPFKPTALSAATLYNLLKVAFAFAAGIGGVVALVTAYRRQRVAESAQELAIHAEKHQREMTNRADQREATRLFNERFTTAAGQLGHDSPAVRLAGVYAMAGLADDWFEQRQTCVDVLCAYLRMPYQPEPENDAPVAELQAFRSMQEVRHTVIRVITAHLQADDRRAATVQDWHGLDFDFTGANFDGGSFRGAVFGDGTTSFRGAQFRSGAIDFVETEFKRGTVDFSAAQFTGSRVRFNLAHLSGGTIDFSYAKFRAGVISFSHAKFSGGTVSFTHSDFDSTISFHEAEFGKCRMDFSHANFNGDGRMDFGNAKFGGTIVDFGYAKLNGGHISFSSALISAGSLDFVAARFAGSRVDFNSVEVTPGGSISFYEAEFKGGKVGFTGAKVNGTVDFLEAEFTGGQVHFGPVLMWSHPPMGLSLDDPPPGVTLQPTLDSPGFT